MRQEEVERSEAQIGRDQFELLTSLIQKQAWLGRRTAALFDTVTLCQCDDENKLLVDLLERFHYASEEHLKDKISVIAKTISEDWGCTPDGCVIASINNGEFSDSSDMMAYRLKGALVEYEDWMTHNFINKLGSAVEAITDGGTIVLVDDFAGSGNSIRKKVEWLDEKLLEIGKEAEVRVAIAAAMKPACELLKATGKTFFVAETLSRGISDHFHGSELEKYKRAMERLESELCRKFKSKKLKDYSFGYKATEALYYAEGLNPPNNNFPIFWWPLLKGKKKRDTILRRI